MTLNEQQFGLVQGPTVDNHRILPRLPGGKPPETLYRVTSDAEWAEAQKTGVLRSNEGRLHASAQPEPGWAEPGRNHMLEISYSDDDGWQHKDTMQHGYATVPELPIDRIKAVRSYNDKRSLVEGERG